MSLRVWSERLDDATYNVAILCHIERWPFTSAAAQASLTECYMYFPVCAFRPITFSGCKLASMYSKKSVAVKPLAPASPKTRIIVVTRIFLSLIPSKGSPRTKLHYRFSGKGSDEMAMLAMRGLLR